MKRIRLGLIFGGRSVEHEVSLVSARSVLAAIDPSVYEVVPIGVTRQGKWLTSTEIQTFLGGRIDGGGERRGRLSGDSQHRRGPGTGRSPSSLL